MPSRKEKSGSHQRHQNSFVQQMSVKGASIEHLSWSDSETEKFVHQLEYMTEKVVEDKSRFPKETVTKLLRALQGVIQNKDLKRDDPLLEEVSTAFRDLQLVDLDKLSHLLHKTQAVGDQLANKDLLLLSGPSGCGKTTTLQYLSGTSFMETEVDGFFHLEPQQYASEALAKLETSCCRYGVTQTLQISEVTVDGKPILICDTPGFDTLDSIEEDIAHGIGTVRAIQKARTVRPVLVFCRENLGHRFVNLDKTWSMVMQQFVLGPDTGLKPFNYVFTKFDEKHRTRLCQQFAHFKQDLSSNRKNNNNSNKHRNNRSSPMFTREEEEVFKTFIDDIVQKTTPEAKVVSPMKEPPHNLLRELIRNSYPITDPTNFFAPMASSSSLSKLSIQFEMTLHQLTTGLAREDYDVALQTLQQLMGISKVLPEAKEYARRGKKATLVHASLLFHSIGELFDQNEYPTAIFRIQKLHKLAELLPEANECTELAHELLWRSLVEAMESHNFGKSVQKIVEASELISELPKARAGIQQGLELKEKKISQACATGDCTEACDLLLELTELAKGYPESGKYIQVGFKALQKEVMNTIDEKRLVEARDQMHLIAKLVPHIPQAAEFSRHGLKMLLYAVEKKVHETEYSVTVNLIQTLMELTDIFPDSNESVNRGIQIIWNIFGLVLEDKHYIRAIGIVQVISGLIKVSPKAFEYTRLGIEVLGDRLLRTIQERNYNVALKMLLHLTKLECEFPETLKSECVTHGLKMIKQTTEVAISKKDYPMIVELFHDLIQLEPEVPEAGRTARSMLTMMQQEFEKSVKQHNFGTAIDLLQSFASLEQELPEVADYSQRSQDIFLKEVKEIFSELEGIQSIDLIERLMAEEGKIFIAGECARYGLKKAREAIEEKIEQHDLIGAAEMWQRLYQLSLRQPRAKKTVQAGFLLLREELAASLTEQNYKSATFIMQHFSKVERELPEADKCARQTLTVLKNALLSSIEQQDYAVAMDLLQMLVNNSKDFPEAFKSAQLGLKQLQRALETKVLDKQEYRKALAMMEKAIKLSEELPEALKCAQGGLKVILKAIENAIDQSDYGVAVDLINHVHKLTKVLPEAFLCSEIGLQAAVRHLTWIRREVETIVGRVTPDVEQEKFTEMMLQLKGHLQNIMKSESLRFICMKLHKESLGLPSEEEFCLEQLRLLTEIVVADLLNIEIDKSDKSSLIQMRASLLSTMVRLKVMNELLYQCPGGGLVREAYDEAFKDFYALLDSVLAAAENRNKPPEQMDVFELQASFLEDVIKGFTECRLDIEKHEYLQMEELEHRRARLMQRFDDQVIEAKDLLSNYAPLILGGTKTEPSFSYIQKMDLKQLAGPRKAIQSLGKAPKLCNLMPSNPQPTDLIVFVKRFDLSLTDSLERIIYFLEKEHQELVKAQKNLSDVFMLDKMGRALQADIRKIEESLAYVGKWSSEVESRCRPHSLRLYRLKESVNKTLGIDGTASGCLNPFQCF